MTQVIADVYSDFLGSGNVGDAFNQTIANNGSHGGNGWSGANPAGMTIGATSASRKMFGSINVGGALYGNGGSRSLAYNNTQNFSTIAYFLPANKQIVAVGCWITFNQAVNGFAHWDLIQVVGQNTGRLVTAQFENGAGATYSIHIEATTAGGTNNSSAILLSQGASYWVSLLADYSGGTAKMALFDTTNTQVGSTVTVAQDNTDNASKVLFGNNEAGTDSSTTFFENIVFNWSSPIANYPLGPGSGGFVSSVVDSRNSTCGLVPATHVYPNGSRVVQGTTVYDQETSNNTAVPGTDSRAAGAPVDSRVASIIPQNSRT